MAGTRIDHPPDIIFCSHPFVRRCAAERQTVQYPAPAGPHRGETELFFGKHLIERSLFEDFGRGRKYFHRIKAESPRFSAGGDRVIPKNERATPGLFHQTDRDARFFHRRP